MSIVEHVTANTTPKRLRKGTADKRHHDLRKHALKVPCRCTKQFIIRIPQLQHIRIWTEFWILKDYDTRRAFMYTLFERKPVQGNNEQRAKKTLSGITLRTRTVLDRKCAKFSTWLH